MHNSVYIEAIDYEEINGNKVPIFNLDDYSNIAFVPARFCYSRGLIPHAIYALHKAQNVTRRLTWTNEENKRVFTPVTALMPLVQVNNHNFIFAEKSSPVPYDTLLEEETEEELPSELPPLSGNNMEKHYQEYLYRLLGGQKEVECPAGYIDLLTDTDLIEIKNCQNNGGWKSAIGQVVVYRNYYPLHRCFIYLYNVKEQDKDLIESHCGNFNITPMYLK